MPELEEKVQKKTNRLKTLNHENLRLMERINQLENSKKEKLDASRTSLIKIGNSDSLNDINTMRMSKADDMDVTNNNNKTMISRFKYTEYGKENVNSILNITDMVEDNQNLRDKFDNLAMLKDRLKLYKKESKFLSGQISDINSQVFFMTKLFTEGMHELSRELLKVHEIQLDKVISSKYIIYNAFCRKLLWKFFIF